MNKHLISKEDFTAMLDGARQCATEEEAHTKVWFTIANRILANWNGNSYGFLKALTPGQYAATCSAEFFRGVKGADLITVVSISDELPGMTLKALEILGANEYLYLLKEVESVFPKKQFPKYAEDVMAGYGKAPKGFFDKVGERFIKAKDMQRPLHHYAFSYITAHPDEFCA